VTVRVAHTADLGEADLRAIRRLLHDTFDDLDEHDVEHCLGGMHVLVHDGDELIAHGSVVMRRLRHGDRALRTGYVEAVAVRENRRRQGHGATVMAELERLIRGGYDIGALGSSDEGAPFYTARGWRPWPGTASVVTPEGLRRTPEEEGGIYVFGVTAELDDEGDLACDWREGDVW
jgi:aminoglycoside 2'-N-acetyltransferase I